MLEDIVLSVAPAPSVGSLVIGFMVTSLFGCLVLGFTLNNQPNNIDSGGGRANAAKGAMVNKDVEAGTEENCDLKRSY